MSPHANSNIYGRRLGAMREFGTSEADSGGSDHSMRCTPGFVRLVFLKLLRIRQMLRALAGLVLRENPKFVVSQFCFPLFAINSSERSEERRVGKECRS